MRKRIIGIMGPGESASDDDIQMAFECGQLLAQAGYTILTGGRSHGVMHAAMKGVRKAGGLCIGVLPDSDTRRMSEYVDVPIITGMGNARNNINILSSDFLVFIGMGAGTLSELALMVKNGKSGLGLNVPEALVSEIQSLCTYNQQFQISKELADIPEMIKRSLN